MYRTKVSGDWSAEGNAEFGHRHCREIYRSDDGLETPSYTISNNMAPLKAGEKFPDGVKFEYVLQRLHV
jgi:hypothetical protein